MSRPLLKDGKLPMQIFINHGYRYAVTRTSVRKENGSYNHPMKIWGTIDENLLFVPNARFQNLSKGERDRILIPAEWKIGNLEERILPTRGRSSYGGSSKNLLYGHTWFLNMLADQSGLRDDLNHVFEDSDMTDKILSMAYFSLLNEKPYSHLAQEQQISWFPSKSTLESWDITRILSGIGEEEKQALFRCRKARANSKSWVGIDSTSFTHFGRHLADAKRGKNKEHDIADQINELVVYDLTNSAPVYYRKMPGNIHDTRSMKITLQELKENGFANAKLIFDRGYVSEEVLEMLVKRNHSFVMMAKTTDAQIAKAIRDVDYDEMTSYSNWISGHNLFGKVFDYKFFVSIKGEQRPVDTMKLCLFFDPELQGETRKKVTAAATETESQICNMIKDKETVDSETLMKFSRHFDVVLTKQGLIKNYKMNEERMKKDVRKTGYFAVIVNRMPPSPHLLKETLDVCDMRDEQEKAFMFIKSEQERRRFRTSKENTSDGRLFIQFVALILNRMIYKVFFVNDELQKMFPTRQHMLEELRSIRIIQHPQKAKMVTEIVGRQIDVFQSFNLPIPLSLLPKDKRQKYANTISSSKC